MALSNGAWADGKWFHKCTGFTCCMGGVQSRWGRFALAAKAVLFRRPVLPALNRWLAMSRCLSTILPGMLCGQMFQGALKRCGVKGQPAPGEGGDERCHKDIADLDMRFVEAMSFASIRGSAMQQRSKQSPTHWSSQGWLLALWFWSHCPTCKRGCCMSTTKVLAGRQHLRMDHLLPAQTTTLHHSCQQSWTSGMSRPAFLSTLSNICLPCCWRSPHAYTCWQAGLTAGAVSASGCVLALQKLPLSGARSSSQHAGCTGSSFSRCIVSHSSCSCLATHAFPLTGTRLSPTLFCGKDLVAFHRAWLAGCKLR